MRRVVLILLLMSTRSFAQSIEEAEQKISYYLGKINYWDLNELNDDQDSLSIYNEALFSFMTHFLQSTPSSIKAKFEIARSKELDILTSADGKFRIYCWNTQEGGTMQFFKTIFQFSNSEKVAVLPVTTNRED